MKDVVRHAEDLLLSVLRDAIGFRTCAIKVPRHIGHMRAGEQPHPKSEERHQSGNTVEDVRGEEVPTSIVLHFPLGVIFRGIDVKLRHIPPHEGVVVAHFTRSTVRRSVRHKQRD